LILLVVPPLGAYNYITPRRAGLSATAGLSCLVAVKTHFLVTSNHCAVSPGVQALLCRDY